MPRELIAAAPRTPALREYADAPLAPGEIRVRSGFSAPKHGTELRAYRADSKDDSAPFDGKRRMHVDEPRESRFPRALGNIVIGTVSEVAADVTRFVVGDRVFAHRPIRETHTGPAGTFHAAPEGMSAEALVYTDPAGVALAAVRESHIRVGDGVAVMGLGAIGQMAAQIARLQGARWIAVSDPIARRRELAIRHGADMAIDPLADDVGTAIKDATDDAGVDVSLETSGNYGALNDTLRATGYGGTVVSSAYYAGDARALSLEGEWHRNRLTIVSIRDQSAPMRDHPLWDPLRLAIEGHALLEGGRLHVEGLVHPIVPFDECAEAYRQIDEDPASSIKLGIQHSSA
ncbi:zinc-binding alcohol dehydrogenase [Candidatus Poribacteria bacterium]|jgi:threonine dehydrogenase-like Zn-dependent dehydrogenase|nr:zinc-binding alcohol dehydrogenase [Candidatus Poribacteria bacterium]MBT5534699.1 zinc-binding alcohol dehydrogenase [Candidatus Poribacteria bacterium]MBT5711069.1 zinc-binding alcohol dehydrogenase [Candidatus Poribacteria bacterium]MBT7809358.1 zinc-binding alcohol dehydrogenase [Candidatus Poribacteria bacterium]